MFTTMIGQAVDTGIQAELEDVGTALVVRLLGEATYERAEELRGLLQPVLSAEPRLVVLDLSELTEASSLALAALVELRWHVCRRWGEVRLANLRPNVRLHITAVGLHRYFPIHDSVAEALAA